jgi:hypothetical protein
MLAIALLVAGLGYFGLRKDRHRTVSDPALAVVSVGGAEEQSEIPEDWDSAIFRAKSPARGGFSSSWLETIDLLETPPAVTANSASDEAYALSVPAFMPPCSEPESSPPVHMPYATEADEQAHR